MGSIVSSVTDSVGSLFGGDTPSQPNTQIYQPGGTGKQDQNLQDLLNRNSSLVGANNPFTQMGPQFAQLFQSLFNNPGASGYRDAASTGGAALTSAGNMAVGDAPALNTAAMSLLPGAASVMNMGMDPRGELYNRTLQQVNDQANVANAQYGLQGQQAAGNLQEADKNFNIDWQSDQLKRAIEGLTAGGNAITNASGNAINASNLGTTGANNIIKGGEAPFMANQNIGNAQEEALMNYIMQLMGPVTSSQSTIANEQTYLDEGVSASSSQASQSLADWQARNKAAGDLGAGLANMFGLTNGGLGSDITSIFSGGSGGGSGGFSSIMDMFGGGSNGGVINSAGPGSAIDSSGGGSGGGGFDMSSVMQYVPMIMQAFAMMA